LSYGSSVKRGKGEGPDPGTDRMMFEISLPSKGGLLLESASGESGNQQPERKQSQ